MQELLCQAFHSQCPSPFKSSDSAGICFKPPHPNQSSSLSITSATEYVRFVLKARATSLGCNEDCGLLSTVASTPGSNIIIGVGPDGFSNEWMDTVATRMTGFSLGLYHVNNQASAQAIQSAMRHNNSDCC
ncbi:hypothetical protein PGTUg99_013091 [Puccinia graminis f. sp. tritici]|uniref:Uncharacterized protein n=1 Tax=Puccinia graminis f. sp. tritici TaxID=56615 RepID=A0A5B0SI81_PUCGR|nr:hypothetical protein PGTUg99_013091 [Puccinia graminis f. sp. tritici]